MNARRRHLQPCLTQLNESLWYDNSHYTQYKKSNVHDSETHVGRSEDNFQCGKVEQRLMFLIDRAIETVEAKDRQIEAKDRQIETLTDEWMNNDIY